jgi:hypothetical protein
MAANSEETKINDEDWLARFDNPPAGRPQLGDDWSKELKSSPPVSQNPAIETRFGRSEGWPAKVELPAPEQPVTDEAWPSDVGALPPADAEPDWLVSPDTSDDEPPSVIEEEKPAPRLRTLRPLTRPKKEDIASTELVAPKPEIDPSLSAEIKEETEGGSQDWLSELRQSAESAVLLAATEQVAETGVSDWANEATETEFEFPAWLADSEEVGPAVSTEPTGSPGIEIPDWLTDLSETPSPAETSTFQGLTSKIEPEVEETESEFPDWLSDLPTTDEVEEAEEETPDWLAGVAIAGAAGIVGEVEAEAEAETEVELPDWLSDLPTTDEVEAETPDWLAGLREAEAIEADEPERLKRLTKKHPVGWQNLQALKRLS